MAEQQQQHEETGATHLWSKECEIGLSGQIRLELYASYVYMTMHHFFDHDDVALPKIEKYFKEASHKEREHAEMMMKYHNKRGGCTTFNDITFQDFIEANFLHEQVDAIHELKGYITNLQRVGEGLGEFLFDKHFKKSD